MLDHYGSLETENGGTFPEVLMYPRFYEYLDSYFSGIFRLSIFREIEKYAVNKLSEIFNFFIFREFEFYKIWKNEKN